MDRVVVLGRGGAGKSTLARRVAAVLDAPLVELDALFWCAPDLRPLDRPTWVAAQRTALPADRCWVADGDLGPYDDLSGRLPAADTVVVLDYGFARCAWRAVRRGRERSDFWWWVLTYRVRWRPAVLRAVDAHAPTAALIVLRSPRRADAWLRGRLGPVG